MEMVFIPMNLAKAEDTWAAARFCGRDLAWLIILPFWGRLAEGEGVGKCCISSEMEENICIHRYFIRDEERASSSQPDEDEAMVKTLEMGRVALVVNDLQKVSDWYQSDVGLHLLSADGEVARLGVGDQTLIELRQDKGARRRSPREAGLFHTAFLLPERADLGRWVLDASARRIAVEGLSDHDVSEAVYLSDPEGNGVEIYIDRPESAWKRGPNGAVHMTSEALDVQSLAASGMGGTWRGVPEGTKVGHVHLQVGDTALAEKFYKDDMGLTLTCRYPGGLFYAADGYHHHIATNMWNSRGAGMRDFPSTGLIGVEMKVSPQRLAELKAQFAVTAEGEFTLADPWGTPLAISVI